MLKTYFNKILKFLKLQAADTVDDILASFNKQIDQLQALANKKFDEAQDKWSDAVKLRTQAAISDAEGEAAQAEATKAEAMANKIKDFTNV